MSTIKSLMLFGGALSLGLVSCKKSFLDKKPVSDLTSANNYTTASDAEAGLTGAYRGLVNGNFYLYDNPMNTDGRSDNCYVNGDNTTAEQPLENFTYTSANTNIQRDWQELYTDISDANAVLDKVPGINDLTWAGTNRKSQILGEARFLRAMAYYWLVTEWGSVPLVLTDSTGSNLYPTRSSVPAVYAQIVTDLVYADTTLPVTPYNGQLGRATQGAADALLAKTYAQMGDYTNCLVYANKVINSGTYSLLSDFSKLWGGGNKNNAESIFEIEFPGTGYTNWGAEMVDYVASDAWPKRNIGSSDLIKAFQAAGDNGARYTSTFNWQIANASFNMPANAWDYTAPIPFMNKWPDPAGYNSPDDIVLLRLADIILLAAEANNQLGNTGDAITELNLIRTRAGLPNTTATTQADLGMAILNERRLELVFEGTRWNDLLRAEANGYLNIVTLMNSQENSYGANINYNMNADKHQYLFPVPLEDIQLNKNLTQNNGY